MFSRATIERFSAERPRASSHEQDQRCIYVHKLSDSEREHERGKRGLSGASVTAEGKIASDIYSLTHSPSIYWDISRVYPQPHSFPMRAAHVVRFS